MVEFTAHSVSVEQDDDLGVLTIAFAGGRRGQRLEIQRSMPSLEAGAGSPESYCLVTADGRSRYGGVGWWSLEGCRLTLALWPDACSDLRVEGGFAVELAPCHGPELGQLRRALEFVFGPAAGVEQAVAIHAR